MALHTKFVFWTKQGRGQNGTAHCTYLRILFIFTQGLGNLQHGCKVLIASSQSKVISDLSLSLLLPRPSRTWFFRFYFRKWAFWRLKCLDDTVKCCGKPSVLDNMVHKYKDSEVDLVHMPLFPQHFTKWTPNRQTTRASKSISANDKNQKWDKMVN